ncbi:CPBP family intramembrane glutamic endopeptidase [Brevibacillus sp. B_LB10_24]|uniref:CPBP family intramembrane glutamic endopeptidase n=1 Tax=Brevibacillus sp. B_LB10_24 TaxID=3380645 RepID=UPI0038BB9247
MTDQLKEMDQRTLYLNLLLTQGIVLCAGIILSLTVHGWQESWLLFRFPGWRAMAFAVGAASAIAALSLLLERILPKQWLDDGELNRRIFHGLSMWQTALLCGLVGLSEEWLFRGVIQPLAGNLLTSLAFALIHFRYLRKPFLSLTVFLTSLVLGWLYQSAQSLLVPIEAHSLFNFFMVLSIQYGPSREGDE